MPTQLDDYVLTLMPDDTIAIWHEGMTEPYSFTKLKKGGYLCTCPGYRYHGHCRHDLVVKFGYIWNKDL